MKSLTNSASPFPNRGRPARDGGIEGDPSAIIFITVCTKQRRPLLANDRCHQILRKLWSQGAHWLVGNYVILPDHIHLFAGRTRSNTCTLEQWVSWWKRETTCSLGLARGQLWQDSQWDRRIRSEGSLSQKYVYIRENPVRHGYVSKWSDWPYQGEIIKFGHNAGRRS